MVEQTIHSVPDSLWTKWCNLVARSWFGQRLGVESRLQVEVTEHNGAGHTITLHTTPEDREYLRRELRSPVPLPSLGLPSHGALRQPGAKDVLCKGLRERRRKQRRNIHHHLHCSINNSHQLEEDLAEILGNGDKLSAAEPSTLIEQLHQLLSVHERGVALIRKRLDVLAAAANEEEDGSNPFTTLVRKCRMLAQLIDALPETLELPNDAPLRLMLNTESLRLERLLQDFDEDPCDKKLLSTVEEFIRIEEVLHSDLAASPHLKGQDSALIPFTAKLQELCRSYGNYCNNLAA